MCTCGLVVWDETCNTGITGCIQLWRSPILESNLGPLLGIGSSAHYHLARPLASWLKKNWQNSLTFVMFNNLGLLDHLDARETQKSQRSVHVSTMQDVWPFPQFLPKCLNHTSQPFSVLLGPFQCFLGPSLCFPVLQRSIIDIREGILVVIALSPFPSQINEQTWLPVLFIFTQSIKADKTGT